MDIHTIPLITSDFIQYSPFARLILSHLLEQADRFRSAQGCNSTARSLSRLSLAARLGHRERGLDGLEAKIRAKLDQWPMHGFEWDSFYPGWLSGKTPVARSSTMNRIRWFGAAETAPRSFIRAIQKSIILKSPQPGGEKGVLFVSFENNWLKLLRYGDISSLAREYHLVISPTWSPPYDLALLIACRLWPGTLFTIVSNLSDVAAFGRICNKVVVIPLLASSWVNPETFVPTEGCSKQYEIAVLANFAQYKRHVALFRALRRMGTGVRVLLLGQAGGGRTKATLEREARWYGVLHRITIMENLADKEMIKALQSAKVSVIMSKREGSCVAVAESLFADVPVGLLKDANVGSSAFINAETGRFLRERNLAEDLADFVEHYSGYHPRRWMLENGVSYRESSRILNDSIRSWVLKAGEQWTTDLLPMIWRPNPIFASEADAERVKDEYSRFERAYGIPVSPTRSEEVPRDNR